MIKRVAVINSHGRIIGYDWYFLGIPILINSHKKYPIDPKIEDLWKPSEDNPNDIKIPIPLK